MNNERINFDKLQDAMDEYNEAKAEHDKAFEEFDGHSWDYFGSRFISRMDKAKEAWQTEFQNAVDAGVRRALARLTDAGKGAEDGMGG